jgi:hypothetical protein
MALTLRKGPAIGVPFAFGYDAANNVQVPVFAQTAIVGAILGHAPNGVQWAHAVDGDGRQVPVIIEHESAPVVSAPSRLGIPFTHGAISDGSYAPVVGFASGLTEREGPILGTPFAVAFDDPNDRQTAMFGIYSGSTVVESNARLGVPFAFGVDGDGNLYPLIRLHPDSPIGGGGGEEPVLVLAGTSAAFTQGDPSTHQDDYVGFSSIVEVAEFGTGDASHPWAVYFLHSFGADYGGGEINASSVVVDADLGVPFTYCTLKLNGVEVGTYQMLDIGAERYGAIHARDVVPVAGQSIELSMFTDPFPEDGALAWNLTAGDAGEYSGYYSAFSSGDAEIGTVNSGPAAKMDACYSSPNEAETALDVYILTTLNNPATTLTVSVNGGAPLAIPFILSEGIISGRLETGAPTLVAGDILVVSLS